MVLCVDNPTCSVFPVMSGVKGNSGNCLLEKSAVIVVCFCRTVLFFLCSAALALLDYTHACSVTVVPQSKSAEVRGSRFEAAVG